MLVLLLSLNIFEKKIADWGKLVGNSFLQQIHTVHKINLKKITFTPDFERNIIFAKKK